MRAWVRETLFWVRFHDPGLVVAVVALPAAVLVGAVFGVVQVARWL